MTELDAILATMTPEERAKFNTINAAVASGVLTDAERRALPQRVKDDRWVASLSARMVTATNRGIKSA